MDLLNIQKIAIAIIFATSTIGVVAQDTKDDNTKKGMTITAFNFEFGTNWSYSVLTNDDYLMMRNTAVDQSLFISNPEDYDLSYFSGNGGSFAPSVSIGLTPYSKKLGALNYNRELRIKLGGSFGGRRSFFYSDKNSFPYDTLSSSVGNPDILIDSVHYSNFSYIETVSEINIGASYLFKTDASKRWYFYTGVGAEYGFAFQDYVTINESEYSYLEDSENASSSPYYSPYYYNIGNYESKSSKSKLTSNSHFVRVYIPLGVNFRITNKDNFFRHTNLYMQFSPGIEFQIVTGVDTYVNPFLGWVFLGFRYTIN